MNHEEINLNNPTDFNLPSFQAHFSLPSPNVRPVETNRCKRKTKAMLFFFVLIPNIQLVIIIISFMVCIEEGERHNNRRKEKETNRVLSNMSIFVNCMGSLLDKLIEKEHAFL